MGTKKKRPGKASWLLLLVFIGVFCFSSYKIYTQLSTEHSENQAFEELLREVQADREARQSGVRPTGSNPEPTDASQAADDLTPADVLPPETTAAKANAAPDATAAPASGTADQQANADPVPAEGVTDDVTAPQASALPVPTETPAPSVAAPPTNTPAPTEVPPILSDYATLHKRNKHLFGWLEIPETNVNYPVMHVPTSPEYYLHRAFDGSYSFSGVPFLAGECFIGCGNYIVYGHHMKNDTMFAEMVYYEKEEFWRKSPIIHFDTLYAHESYEVIAAFHSKIYPANTPDVFRYYQYVNLTNPDVFDEYVAQIKAISLYDTGIDAVYGDQLLTLSTCSYHTQDGRFVVVARRVSSVTEAETADVL